MPLTPAQKAYRASPEGKAVRNAWLRKYRKAPAAKTKERDRGRRRRGAEINRLRVKASYLTPTGRAQKLAYQRRYDAQPEARARHGLRLCVGIWPELVALFLEVQRLRAETRRRAQSAL